MSQLRRPYLGWSQRVILGGIALGGLVGCLGLYHALGLWEQSRREADFRLQVQQQFHIIENHIRSTFGAVEAVAAFFQSSQYVEPEEFKTFTRPLLAKHPGLHELGWAGPDKTKAFSPKPAGPSGPPQSSAQGRVSSAFLQGTQEAVVGRGESLADKRLKSTSTSESPRLKIHYLEVSPWEVSGQPFLKPQSEFSSRTEAKQLVQELWSGKELVVRRIWLAEHGNRWAFLIGVLVSRSRSGWQTEVTPGNERKGKMDQESLGGEQLALRPSATSEGVVFGISEPCVLMEQALRDLPGNGIEIYWYEGEAEEKGRLICYWPGSTDPESGKPVGGRELVAGLYESEPMALFDQSWRFYGRPTKAFLAQRSSLIPELVVAGGLMAVCLLVAYVHALFSRHSQVEALVERRTVQLQKAKEDIELREQSLRDSQALYWSLVEGLPVAILRKNRQGRFTFANQAFCRMVKRPIEEILGKTDWDFYPPELAQKYQADDRRVMESGEPFETVEENVQEGVKRYVQVIKCPVRDAAGEITEVQVIFWDVTERRRAELALEKERALLHTLMDYLPDNIYFKDQQSRFLRINRALARYLGLADPSEAEGKTDFDFFSSEHAEQALADEQYILATGRPIINKEEKETWPDGRISWVLTTKLPLRDPEGRIIGTYGISRDITQQKLAAEALKAAKEAAETASQAKSQFLANISHELRTPLHGLLGLAELVLDGPLEPAQRAYLEMIRDAGENLLLVLNDLLDFSKIEAARLELEHIPFRLRELVGQTLKSFAFLAHGKGLRLVWYIRPDVPEMLVGDPLRLRQILGNLVANAIKFTDHGEISVEVCCMDRQANRVELGFQVRDTGIGIPPEKLDRIFEMFEQAEKSTARKYGGTGLGLAICSRLVALMQGRIWAESQPGHGSCFQFTAWFGLPEQPEPWPTQQQLAALQNRRILVLESHPLERQNLEDLLRSWAVEPIGLGSFAQLRDYWPTMQAGPKVDGLLCGMLETEADRSVMAEMLADWFASGGRMVWIIPAGWPLATPWTRQPSQEAMLIKPYTPSELLAVVLWMVGAGAVQRPVPPTAESVAVPAGRPLRILVAEDSPVGQQLAVALLERYGHKVSVVRTGREALAAVQTETFDLLLMDLELPEMDGWEAAKAIREWEKEHGGHLPIIAVTAHELSEELAKVRAYGMDYYIGKPLRARPLLQAIAQLLPNAPSPPEPGPAEQSPPQAHCSRHSEQVVDWQRALGAVRGDEHLLQTLLLTLLQEAPECFQNLQQAAAQQDLARLRLAAHSLKGSLRLLGSTPAYEQAWAIEQLAQAGTFPTQQTMQELEKALNQLLHEVKKRFGGS
ncbi:MAG: PAS domain-containing protein [Thermoguttaceae bacterium]|nr:PAS domain-containing protein [Thermoguttaceae bacterium]